MKRKTTRNGPLKKKKIAVLTQKEIQDILSQQQIQRWIERIPRHIQEIIWYKGGNKYIEGRGVKRTYPKKEECSNKEANSELEWEDISNIL